MPVAVLQRGGGAGRGGTKRAAEVMFQILPCRACEEVEVDEGYALDIVWIPAFAGMTE